MAKEHFEKKCLLRFSVYFHFRAGESIDLWSQGPLLVKPDFPIPV